MKINASQARGGFSLVEILVVMAIIAVIASFGFGTYFLVNKNAKVTQAEVMLENLGTNLENKAAQRFTQEELAELEGLLETGETYPKGDGSDRSSTDLYAFLSGDYDNNGRVDAERSPAFKEMDPEYSGKGKYLNDQRLIIDPWKTPIRYEFPGEMNNVEEGFDLWSAGPDRKFNTEDDVKNW